MLNKHSLALIRRDYKYYKSVSSKQNTTTKPDISNLSNDTIMTINATTMPINKLYLFFRVAVH